MASGLIGIAYGLLQLAISTALAVISIFFGSKAFDKLTPGIDELKEIRKGNVAVGIVVGAVVVSVALMMRAGVLDFASIISPGTGLGQIVYFGAISLAKLAISLLGAVMTVYVSFYVLDYLTQDIEEAHELRRGNVAVAILVASVLISVSAIVGAFVQSALY